MERHMVRMIWAERTTERHTVLVTFANDDFLMTEINGTREEIESYYLGRWFNVGTCGRDDMQRADRIEFLS